MDYDECIALISAAEAYDTESRTVAVDVYDFGPELAIREYSEKEATKLIDAVESSEGLHPQKEEAVQAPKEKPKQPEIMQQPFVRLNMPKRKVSTKFYG